MTNIKNTGLQDVLNDAGIEPQWREIFVSGTEQFDSADQAALRALIERTPSAGKAGMLVSRRLRNLRTNWYQMLKQATTVTGASVATLTAAHGLHLVWLTGAAFPWAPVGGAVLGLMIAWRAVTGLLDVELSDGHAKTIYLLWLNRHQKVTLEDIHATLDAELGADNVSNLLTDLSDLGLVRFGVGRVELLDEVVLS